MKHYVIISSDCHAGPDSPVYREYLEPEYREPTSTTSSPSARR